MSLIVMFVYENQLIFDKLKICLKNKISFLYRDIMNFFSRLFHLKIRLI